MTVEEFNEELNELVGRYLGKVSSEATRVAFQSLVYGIIAKFYAAGGRLGDARQVPIDYLEDVELVVTRTNHTMNVSAIRRTR